MEAEKTNDRSTGSNTSSALNKMIFCSLTPGSWYASMGVDSTSQFIQLSSDFWFIPFFKAKTLHPPPGGNFFFSSYGPSTFAWEQSPWEYPCHTWQPDTTHLSLSSQILTKYFSWWRFSDCHQFEKPNDPRAIKLMNAAARGVMRELPDLTIAYGVSDEFRYLPPRPLLILLPVFWLMCSFVFHRGCQLFERRSRWAIPHTAENNMLYVTIASWCSSSKLVTTIVSTFTAHYIHQWSTFFPDSPLEPGYLPTFDGRVILYPSVRNLRDYMSWRQVDCTYISREFIPFRMRVLTALH